MLSINSFKLKSQQPHNKSKIDALAFLKAVLLTQGVRLSPLIGSHLIDKPFYSVVTSGIELEFDSGIVANAPINSNSPVLLRQIEDRAEISFNGFKYHTRIFPVAQSLFKYIPDTSIEISNYCHISTDRINIWSIESCSQKLFDKACSFCDVGYDDVEYCCQPLDRIQYAMNSVLKDNSLTINHIQVSGGTPLKEDWDHYLSVCRIAVDTGLPVSAMLTPWAPDSVFDELFKIGVCELALNVEFASEEARKKFTPGKRQNPWDRLGLIASKWTKGKVRSALIVGLEDERITVNGINKLFDIGVVPMLSPFRPAKNTPLARYPITSADLLYRVYMQGLDMADKYNSIIGPSCRFCQNNVMALPDDFQ